MWYKRKPFIVAICVVAFVGCCVFLSACGSFDTVGEMVIDESCGPESYPLNDNPDMIYEDNSELLASPQNENGEASGLLPIEDMIDLAAMESSGGELVRAEYMTYADFLNEVSTFGDSSPQISDDRVVLAVEIYYPNGFDVRVGHIDNCMAVGLYDAETGEYLGGEYNTVSEN